MLLGRGGRRSPFVWPTVLCQIGGAQEWRKRYREREKERMRTGDKWLTEEENSENERQKAGRKKDGGQGEVTEICWRVQWWRREKDADRVERR